MAPLVSTIVIARRPEEVFAYVTDPLHFAEWQDDVMNVRILGNSRFSTTRRIGGAERTMTQEVTHDHPPHRWVVRSIGGPIRPHATVTISPTEDGSGSLVTFTLDFEGHGLGVPVVPLVRRQARKAAPTSYRNLKEILENGHRGYRGRPR